MRSVVDVMQLPIPFIFMQMIFIFKEIIYQLSMDRSTVMRILDTFSEIVCHFQCQDLVVDDDD